MWRQEQLGLLLQGVIEQQLLPLACGKAPFATAKAHTGGLQLTYLQPHHGKAGFSPSAHSMLVPIPLNANTEDSIEPTQCSEAISWHSTGTEPYEAALSDPAMSTDSK